MKLYWKVKTSLQHKYAVYHSGQQVVLDIGNSTGIAWEASKSCIQSKPDFVSKTIGNVLCVMPEFFSYMGALQSRYDLYEFNRKDELEAKKYLGQFDVVIYSILMRYGKPALEEIKQYIKFLKPGGILITDGIDTSLGCPSNPHDSIKNNKSKFSYKHISYIPDSKMMISIKKEEAEKYVDPAQKGSDF